MFLSIKLALISVSWIITLLSPSRLKVISLHITAVGGMLIFVIGCNLLNITSIQVVNLMPALSWRPLWRCVSRRGSRDKWCVP
ncbi:DUF554 family protein [Paenibacillus sp. GCM10027626]|uniref:DUF554 family protein n=1 Tax=Paenibacillus sp. GCM10027626 TaxID=3273411 RepID=UPI003644A87F